MQRMLGLAVVEIILTLTDLEIYTVVVRFVIQIFFMIYRCDLDMTDMFCKIYYALYMSSITLLKFTIPVIECWKNLSIS